MQENRALLHHLNAQPKLVVRPSLLLLALFLASMPLYVPNARIVRDITGMGGTVDCLVACMAATCLALSIVLIAFSAKHADWAGFERPVLVASAVVYSASSASMWIGATMGVSFGLASACLGVALGASSMPLIIAWIKRYALDIRNVVLHGALSCIGASFVAAGLLVVSPPLAAVLASACALVGAWAPVALGRGGAPSAFERAATASGFRMASRALLSVIWLPLTGFLVCLLMSSSCEFSVSGATLRSELIGGVLASCIALSLCLARRKTPFVLLIDKLVVPGLVAISVVLGGFPAGSLPFVAGAAYIFVPMMFLSLFAISSLAVASATGEFSLPFVFGAAFCLGNLATLVGLAMGGGLAGSDASGPFLWVIICGYFAVVIIQLGYSSWRQLCRPDEADGLARAANPEAVEAYRRRCVERLSDACGLTNREREILGYLSRGYGSSFIAKSLFISDNTARTHIRNIYRKLGVSSREEVLSLFNGDAMGDGV